MLWESPPESALRASGRGWLVRCHPPHSAHLYATCSGSAAPNRARTLAANVSAPCRVGYLTFRPQEPCPRTPATSTLSTSLRLRSLLALLRLRLRSFCLQSAPGLAWWRALVRPMSAILQSMSVRRPFNRTRGRAERGPPHTCGGEWWQACEATLPRRGARPKRVSITYYNRWHSALAPSDLRFFRALPE